MMKISRGMFSPSYAVPTQPSSSGAGAHPSALVPPTPVGPPEPLLPFEALPMLTLLLPTALFPETDAAPPSSSSSDLDDPPQAAAIENAAPTATRLRRLSIFPLIGPA